MAFSRMYSETHRKSEAGERVTFASVELVCKNHGIPKSCKGIVSLLLLFNVRHKFNDQSLVIME
jgi:hypothetical protein